MKRYILNYIKNLDEKKKNEKIKEYIKYLEKEIEKGDKLLSDGNLKLIIFLAILAMELKLILIMIISK